MNEIISKTAGHITEAMKSQPLALALILLNVLFLVVGVIILREIGNAVREGRAESTALIRQLLDCQRPNG
jgi:hypothetical protein